MNLIKKTIIPTIGYLFIGVILYYTLICIAIFFVISSTLLNIKIPSDIYLLGDLQKKYYLHYSREMWQYKEECVETDKTLIYKPKIGTCEFSNIEFNTTLNFDNYSRTHDLAKGKAGKHIAVLGDSHTMGWGVNNNETFSYYLEELIGRNVINFGVSSYATERELERFKIYPYLEKVDTVIIQYCDNDITENTLYPIDKDLSLDKYKSDFDRYNLEKSHWWLKLDFYTEITSLDQSIRNAVFDFLIGPDLSNIDKTYYPHKENLIKILKSYSDVLKDKKVYVFYINGDNKKIYSFEKWAEDKNLNGLNFKFIDVPLQDSDFYYLDDHLNAHGHKKVAKAISLKIQK